MSDPLAALNAVSGEGPAPTSAGLPNIPAVPLTDDRAMANFLQAAKLWMEKAKGEGLTGFATKADLVRNKVLATDEQGNVIPGSGGSPTPDLSLPPAPSGLRAVGAMTSILVEWDAPSYGNHGYAEIWAAETDDFTGAVMVGESGGFVFAHAVGEDQTRYYWVRFVSTAGIKGPYNAVGGTLGQTAKNPTYLLSVLTGELGEQPFYELTEDTVIGGVTVPAGVYMKTAFIADASIDNAKIGDLSADKITSGQLTADRIDGTNLSVVDGQFSGSINCGDGKFLVTADGMMCAENAFVKGDITGSTGTFFGRLAAGVLDDSAFSGQTTEYRTPGTHTITVPNRSDWLSVSCRVTLQGAGGGGGNANSSTYYGENFAGGGGAGENKVVELANLTPGDTYTLVVGQGGVSARAGGATSFAGTSAAGGAAGGSVSPGAGTFGAGGAIGGRDGGLDNLTGQVASGRGGDSRYGSGGASVVRGKSAAANGLPGGVGAGGSGATAYYAAAYGGNGGPGYALIEFYDPNVLVRKKEFEEFKPTVAPLNHTHNYAPTSAFTVMSSYSVPIDSSTTYRYMRLTRANGQYSDLRLN